MRWMLARRLSAAALIIGLLAGGIAYWVEVRRVEEAALEHATTAAVHLASPAIQVLASEEGAAKHEHLQRLLDRSRFIGIRVFDQTGRLVYETWEDVPPVVIQAITAHGHTWPAIGENQRHRIDVAGERLIQVVLPLDGGPNALSGYLEGIYRFDQESLQHQRQQIRGSTLAAMASVIATAVLLYPLLVAMLQHSTGLSRRLLGANLSLIRSLGNAIAERDSDTDAHNYRVTLYAVALAEAMGLSDKEVANIVIGAFLHDVGKIGIPDHILLKPGKLTPEEFEVMKTHAPQGADIVAGNPWVKDAMDIIRHHHEWFDGTGYPDGLRGETIPRRARVFAVVDVFDALTSVRPYKRAMALPEAIAMLQEGSGRHFDPEAVAAFIPIAPLLYERIAQAPEMELHREMRSVLCRYFKTDKLSEEPAQPSCSGQIVT